MANVSVKRSTSKKKIVNIEDLAQHTSRVLCASMKAMRQEYGDANIAVAGEAGRTVIGVSLPSLATEYLLQNTVFPLGRMTQIVGTEGTCKSALCFEIARWFRHFGKGVAVLIENETKYSPDFANSIIGWPEDPTQEVLGHVPSKNMDDWQAKVQWVTNFWRTQMTEKTEDNNGKPPGRAWPVLIILDSIMGKLSSESIEKIEAAGFADRSFPVEALKITNFLKAYPQSIEEWPISFVAVNHLKPRKAEQGYHMERNKAGGRGISFQETFEFEMSRDKNSKISLSGADDDASVFEIGGRRLKISCKKNSLGETDREISISILWKHVRGDDGVTKQQTVFDWPSATIDLLMSFDTGRRKDKLQEIVDIHKTGNNRFWSKALDVSKDSPVLKTELGRLIEQKRSVKNDLRDMFGIKRRKRFRPGVDYLSQLAELKRELEPSLDGPEPTTQESTSQS